MILCSSIINYREPDLKIILSQNIKQSLYALCKETSKKTDYKENFIMHLILLLEVCVLFAWLPLICQHHKLAFLDVECSTNCSVCFSDCQSSSRPPSARSRRSSLSNSFTMTSSGSKTSKVPEPQGLQVTKDVKRCRKFLFQFSKLEAFLFHV